MKNNLDPQQKVVKEEEITESKDIKKQKPAKIKIFKKKHKERKYFEVFGDSVSTLNLFKKLCLLLLFLAIFQIIIIARLSKRSPFIITVDSLGKAEALKNIDDAGIRISNPEISNFIHHFLIYFIDNDFYTYNEDFTRAFKMMTPEAQQSLNGYLSAHTIIENIISNQLKTNLSIVEIHISKNTPEFIHLSVKGNREITSYQDPNFFKEIIFTNEIVLSKTPRTESQPWGLLVDSWEEFKFKE